MLRHELIQHRFQRDVQRGKLSGVVHADGVLRLTDKDGGDVSGAKKKNFISAGYYESEPVALAFPARELVLTWNSRTPFGCWIDVRFCIRTKNGGWSDWFEMGTWGKLNPAERKNEYPKFGKLETDILRAAEDFDAVRYHIDFASSIPGATPELKLVSLCYSGTDDEINKIPHSAFRTPHSVPRTSVELPVPWLSQFRKEVVWDDDMRKAGVCAPTSLTMVLKYYGIATTVYEVAKTVFDESAIIYGNWAFMAAAAGEFGLSAWVQRFSTWDGIIEKVRAGIPPVISIAYEARTFSDAPEKSSAGHLLVVCGCTKDGEIICNDPGAEDERQGRAKRFRSDELGKAFFGHGGVAIIIDKN